MAKLQGEKVQVQMEKRLYQIMKELKNRIKYLSAAEKTSTKVFDKMGLDYNLTWYQDDWQGWDGEVIITAPVIRIAFSSKVGKDEDAMKTFEKLNKELKKVKCSFNQVGMSRWTINVEPMDTKPAKKAK